MKDEPPSAGGDEQTVSGVVQGPLFSHPCDGGDSEV